MSVALLGLSELPTNDDPLSLSLNLSLPLFYNSRESLKCCVVFSKRQEKKREKKNRRESKKLSFKNNHKKSESVFHNNNNNNTTTTTTTKNFSSEFFIINSSLARKKERKKDAFSSGELPESGTYSSYITTHTERERSRDLSFFLSLNSFFVLLSFSSLRFVAFVASPLFAFVFVRELNRENGIGNGAAHALAHSLSETTNR